MQTASVGNRQGIEVALHNIRHMRPVFRVPDILFGVGCLSEIGERARMYGNRVFLVTGESFLRTTGRLDRILASLTSAGASVTIFEGVPPEPSIAHVERGICLLGACPADVVVAVGGGSVLDVGKAIAVLFGLPVSPSEYFGGRLVERRALPFIAAPTTSGTGSEVTPNSVLVDPVTRTKASIRSEHMLPDLAIVDPEITVGLPRRATAYSGMDALCQAIEAFVSRGATSLTDTHARSGAELIYGSLEVCYRDGENRAAREKASLGSLLGGMAFANARLGLVHGLAHPLGVLTHLPHGLVCALLLPDVVEFNLPSAGRKYARLARHIGVAGESASDGVAALALVEALRSLNRELEIDSRRLELRVSRDCLRLVIDQTLASGSTKSNPRDVTEGDVTAMLERIGVVV